MKYDHQSADHRKQLGQKIVSRLRQAGFEEVPRSKGSERIFDRAIPGTKAFVRVYTSVVGQSVREVGADAVRVVGLRRTLVDDEWVDEPIAKGTRVHRTGKMDDVCERMVVRAREVWKASKLAVKKVCSECGANMKMSKKNNLYCSALCWK